MNGTPKAKHAKLLWGIPGLAAYCWSCSQSVTVHDKTYNQLILYQNNLSIKHPIQIHYFI